MSGSRRWWMSWSVRHGSAAGCRMTTAALSIRTARDRLYFAFIEATCSCSGWFGAEDVFDHLRAVDAPGSDSESRGDSVLGGRPALIGAGCCMGAERSGGARRYKNIHDP